MCSVNTEVYQCSLGFKVIPAWETQIILIHRFPKSRFGSYGSHLFVTFDKVGICFVKKLKKYAKEND